uniref:Uncharacterized protein n=1 Tax=Meloidogyne hapla TaxID=6305 RepID=A0A1I8BUQ6_MELHA
MSDDFFENHSPLADKYERVCALLEFCDKYVEINRHNSLLEEWGLIRGMIDFGYSPDIITMDNAIAFVEGYKDKIDETFPDNLLVEKNMFIAMHLYAFARKLIRSFFEVHGIDHIQYYQNLVENCNRNVEGVPTKKLSIFQYLMARDRFEADANNLMFFTNKIPNLQYIENENIKPSADITKENRSCEFVNQYIYQYDDIEDYLTKHECNIIKKRMKQYKEGNAKYRPFYAYYKDFGPEIQRKMEKYIINPFLTHEGNREYAKTNYLGRNQKIRDNSLYLPQPHFELSKLV